ncbi:MAG TPA: glycosyltransferase [Thermoleophilaceae bacterium]|nr:glycosyltransferase [Thermoleophilaceae bacterium]
MNAQPLPEVDVVVPAFNEEGHVERCLDAIFAQDYPSDRYRVWVVDAGSTDGTARVVRERAASDPRLRLVNGQGRLNAAQACNLGIQQGRSELVARVDAHTYLYPDYLRKAAELLAEEGPSVCCVGAQPEQVGETPFGEAVARARGSSFGVGSSVYADDRVRAEVDTIQAGVYRRAPLEEVGGFRTDMLVGEDEELNWRLKKAGYRLILDTSVRFIYTTRSSWGAVFRQHRNYGQSRVRVLTAHPDFLRPYHAAPPALAATLGVLAAASPVSRKARRGLVALSLVYAAGAAAAAVSATRDRPELAPRLFACFPALHLGYGVGMIEGAVQHAGARLGLGQPRTAVRQR